MIAEDSEGKTAGYAIELSAEEWTEYRIHSQESRDYAVSIKVRAIALPATVHVSRAGDSQELAVTSSDWAELTMKAIPLSSGTNRLRIRVKSGAIAMDHLKIE